MNYSLLIILDYFAELIHLVFQLGVYTRKYVVPAVVYLYVAIEQGFEYLTTQEFTLQFPPVTRPHPVTV